MTVLARYGLPSLTSRPRSLARSLAPGLSRSLVSGGVGPATAVVLKKVVIQGIQDAMPNVAAFLALSSREAKAVASGTFESNWTSNNTEIGGVVWNRGAARGGTGARVIEVGRRMGAQPPPWTAIAEWMRDKGIEPFAHASAAPQGGTKTPRQSKGSSPSSRQAPVPGWSLRYNRQRESGQGADDNALRKAATAIAWSIHMRGIHAKRIVGLAERSATDSVMRFIQERLDAELPRVAYAAVLEMEARIKQGVESTLMSHESVRFIDL